MHIIYYGSGIQSGINIAVLKFEHKMKWQMVYEIEIKYLKK